MALPVGHSLAGIAIAKQTEIHPYFAIFLANLPDIDYSFGLILGGGALAYHRSPITHSPGFALFVAILYFIWGKLFRVKNLRKKTIGVFLIVVSHWYLDYFFFHLPYKFDVEKKEYNLEEFFSTFIIHIDFIYNNFVDAIVYGPLYVFFVKFILKKPLWPFSYKLHRKK